MYKFKMKLLYNKEELFCTKTEFLNFKLTLPLTELVMIGARLVSSHLVFGIILQAMPR